MDNASNNNTMMEGLQAIMLERKIPFDRDGRWSDPVSLIYFQNLSSQTNDVRCFPHVINIACQAIIDELKKCEEDIGPDLNAPPAATSSPGWPAYKQAILANPIGKKRGLVAACRSSGQRRRQLKQTTIDGNLTGYWKGKLPGGGGETATGQPFAWLRDSLVFYLFDGWPGLALYPVSYSCLNMMFSILFLDF